MCASCLIGGGRRKEEGGRRRSGGDSSRRLLSLGFLIFIIPYKIIILLIFIEFRY
jgi:hypothetical protein